MAVALACGLVQPALRSPLVGKRAMAEAQIKQVENDTRLEAPVKIHTLTRPWLAQLDL